MKAIVALVIVWSIVFAQAAYCRSADALPQRSEVIRDFSMSELMHRLEEMPLHHIEGIWQIQSSGVEIAIVRREAESQVSSSGLRVYDLILINSANRALRRGTVMGVAVASSKRGEYNARLYTKTMGGTLTLPRRFTLILSDEDSAMEIKPVATTMVYNLWRLLPYLWRYAVYPSRAPKRSDGCIRVYPNPPRPKEPIYF